MTAKRLPQDSNTKSIVEKSCLGFDQVELAELLHSRTSFNSLHSDSHVNDWVADRLSDSRLKVKTIPLREVDRWRIEPDTGNIRHDSGMFFAVTGVTVRHRTISGELIWDQPIIDQPEVGILGILVKKVKGVLHFCLQAKEEPGNINSVQLSPTVQATYSNYTGVHGGSLPPLLGYFLNAPKNRVLFAKLQTEDGGRFLYKSNRNMIVRIGDNELPILPSGFIWLTLRQIAMLMQCDNLIHACTRSILASLLIPHALMGGEVNTEQGGRPDLQESAPWLSESIDRTVQWFDDMKSENHILANRVGLNTLKDWQMDREGFFSRKDGRFFRILGIDAVTTGREIAAWRQPILANPKTGIIGMLKRIHSGKQFYLMQAKAEVGNRTTVQLSPTVQFTPGNYLGNEKLPKPFLFDEFTGDSRFTLISECFQSEEGARFYREQHLHRVLMLPEGMEIDIPPDFRWLSETEIQFFLQLGEHVNSCARSILACLL